MPSKSYAIQLQDSTFKPYVAFNMLYDSNFLRLSNNVEPVLIDEKSDKNEFIKQVSAGFDMDWTISRQHIIIKANANQNWFQNFTTLDYIGWNTQAQWNWQAGNDLNGEIGYANIQTLGSFAYLNTLESNLQNNQHFFANAGYLFHPNGKIKLGLFRNEIQFNNKSRQFSNNIEDNAEFNLQYLSPTGSILGLRLLLTDGQYPQHHFTASDTQDNAYMRFNYALNWDWHASNKTHFDGSFGYIHQHYLHLSIRDFDGIIGGLNLHWQASDKMLLELSAIRDIYQSQNLSANFLLIQGVGFNLIWRSNRHIALKWLMSYQQQQYLGNVGTNVVDFEQQKDTVGNIGFNLMYSPSDNISIGTILNYEKRDSNDPFRSYETRSAGLNLQATF
ncbi:conserved hypothetical protein [Candidatus Methylobacter favarea]|uniref:Uncharacterized protein n=1 Tax=Candidatus Methylobacter favarea TaxID=2707345 RepID=A0A8S0X8R0_9GAMM|nr:XrtB/PEP-CTERM-associated polysaccharide biosynthesis outer membrane protein EpsL [Candidatus Methylobacter favarea]CAA9891402.1 conserved hypothetical protein [Candidatus Methylobacter favarea]